MGYSRPMNSQTQTPTLSSQQPQLIPHHLPLITIFCDGACSGNPGAGGWGCIVEHDGERHEYSGGARHTTNNQMELMALIEALKNAPRSGGLPGELLFEVPSIIER